MKEWVLIHLLKQNVTHAGQPIPAPFVKPENFLDPLQTSDGKPYRLLKYDNILKERFIICKQLGLSYEDTGNMSPLERGKILQLIQKVIKAESDKITEIQKNMHK